MINGSYLFRIGGTEFNELEFIVMFIPVSSANDTDTQKNQFQ